MEKNWKDAYHMLSVVIFAFALWFSFSKFFAQGLIFRFICQFNQTLSNHCLPNQEMSFTALFPFSSPLSPNIFL